ncbi:MAG TPA: STAS-like domain-containing protein [Vicingus sp.]|nr:STAS-like domain-containing protein [Vicingus sp.]HRP60086.1 STAS-like domain-containing protein [Vicingus sp.]
MGNRNLNQSMEDTILFKDISSSLGTRDLGGRVRVDIINKIRENDKVYLDFSGVDVVTNSFADECFRKLRESVNNDIFKSKVAFINANDFVQRVIISAL